MQKFECLLFVLKRSYICYCIICMTVPLMTTISGENTSGKHKLYGLTEFQKNILK